MDPPSNTSPNQPANWKKTFEESRIAPVYKTAAKYTYSTGVGLASKMFKPLKNEENIRMYLNKNRTIKNNLRVVYPNIASLKARRSIQEEENYRFLQDITENKASNLAIARFIESNKSSLAYNNSVNVGLSITNDINISLIHDTLIEELKKAKLLGTDETLEVDKINDIVKKYKEISEWTGVNTPVPKRQRAKLLLTVPEINFILILYEMHINQIKFYNNVEFERGLQNEVDKIRIEEVREKVKSFLNKIRPADVLKQNTEVVTIQTGRKKLVVKRSRTYLTVKPIQFERLFVDRKGNPVCQHIADFPTELSEYMEVKALHHALYFSKDILIEMFPQRLKDGKAAIFISMKTMYDYLKLLRNKNKELYIIPYENPYPNNILRRRALWCLGKYPIYAPYDENCENYPSWVFENNLGLPGMCVPYTKDKVQLYENRRIFFSSFMMETYKGQENTIRGGKTRKRKLKQRQTRRIRNLNA